MENGADRKSPVQFKSGFVAIAGAPNVGKSTLLNRMLGQKISITSKKPQTTRNRILGVVHRPGAQIVFIDTPGVHRAKNPLNLRIVEAALSAMGDADVILLVVDVARPDVRSEALLLEALGARNRPVILAVNKIDRADPDGVAAVLDRWSQAFSFRCLVPVSAKQGTRIDSLFEAIETVLPAGPALFPEDAVTDVPMRFIAAEIIREKAIRSTGEEIPYSIAVTVDEFSEERAGQLIRIFATIHVERDTQKGIIIGKNGQKLRQIGEDARMDIERMTGTKVYLRLFVRVQKHWSKDPRALRKFGYG